MLNPLIIIGTGGNALDILDVVDGININHPLWEVIGFLDDFRASGSSFEKWNILGSVRDAATFAHVHFINCIGSDRSYRKRAEILSSTALPLHRFATLVHPSAVVSSRSGLGPGTCANAGVCVAGNVAIGAHVWLGAGSVIGHDTKIEDYSLIAPQAVISGSVHVGAGAYVGAGACVRQNVSIGDRALVGLGAVVVADVAAESTVVGNPAKALVRHTFHNLSSDFTSSFVD